MKKLTISIVCCMLFAISACVRQATYPPYPIATSVTVSNNSLSGYFANVFVDTVYVTLAFTDGEGGIGPVPLSQDPDTIPTSGVCQHMYDSVLFNDPYWNLYYYTYHASHISTDSCLTPMNTAYVPDNSGGNHSLRGTIQFGVSIDCPGIGNADTLSFSVFFKDRNGKFSNRLRTGNVVVTCQ